MLPKNMLLVVLASFFVSSSVCSANQQTPDRAAESRAMTDAVETVKQEAVIRIAERVGKAQLTDGKTVVETKDGMASVDIVPRDKGKKWSDLLPKGYEIPETIWVFSSSNGTAIRRGFGAEMKVKFIAGSESITLGAIAFLCSQQGAVEHISLAPITFSVTVVEPVETTSESATKTVEPATEIPLALLVIGDQKLWLETEQLGCGVRVNTPGYGWVPLELPAKVTLPGNEATVSFADEKQIYLSEKYRNSPEFRKLTGFVFSWSSTDQAGSIRVDRMAQGELGAKIQFPSSGSYQIGVILFSPLSGGRMCTMQAGPYPAEVTMNK